MFCISIAEILAVLHVLFIDTNLSPHAIVTYNSALIRTLNLAFTLNLSSQIYMDFLKVISNIRSAVPLPPIRWRLDRALVLTLTFRFQSSASLRDSTRVLLFLLALAKGTRGSELQAVLQEENHLVFSGEGVSLYPKRNFLAKNEDPYIGIDLFLFLVSCG